MPNEIEAEYSDFNLKSPSAENVANQWSTIIGLRTPLLDPGDLPLFLLPPYSPYRNKDEDELLDQISPLSLLHSSSSQESTEVDANFLWTDFSFLDTDIFTSSVDLLGLSNGSEDGGDTTQVIPPSAGAIASSTPATQVCRASTSHTIPCPVPRSTAANRGLLVLDHIAPPRQAAFDSALGLMLDISVDPLYNTSQQQQQQTSPSLVAKSAAVILSESAIASFVTTDSLLSTNITTSPFSSTSSSSVVSQCSIDSVPSTCEWVPDLSTEFLLGPVPDGHQSSASTSGALTKSNSQLSPPRSVISTRPSDAFDLPKDFFDVLPEATFTMMSGLLEYASEPMSASAVPMELRQDCSLELCHSPLTAYPAANILRLANASSIPASGPTPAPLPTIVNSNAAPTHEHVSGSLGIDLVGMGAVHVTENIAHNLSTSRTPFCDVPQFWLPCEGPHLVNFQDLPMLMPQQQTQVPLYSSNGTSSQSWTAWGCGGGSPQHPGLQGSLFLPGGGSPLHHHSSHRQLHHAHDRYLNQRHQQYELHPQLRSSVLPSYYHSHPHPRHQKQHQQLQGSYYLYPQTDRNALKRRRRLTTEESEFLLLQFGMNERPTGQERESFAKHLKLDRRTIQVWFQNRRAKLKRDERDEEETQEAEAEDQEQECDQEQEQVWRQGYGQREVCLEEDPRQDEGGNGSEIGSQLQPIEDVLQYDRVELRQRNGYGNVLKEQYNDATWGWEYLDHAFQPQLEHDPLLKLELGSPHQL